MTLAEQLIEYRKLLNHEKATVECLGHRYVIQHYAATGNFQVGNTISNATTAGLISEAKGSETTLGHSFMIALNTDNYMRTALIVWKYRDTGDTTTFESTDAPNITYLRELTKELCNAAGASGFDPLTLDFSNRCYIVSDASINSKLIKLFFKTVLEEIFTQTFTTDTYKLDMRCDTVAYKAPVFGTPQALSSDAISDSTYVYIANNANIVRYRKDGHQVSKRLQIVPYTEGGNIPSYSGIKNLLSSTDLANYYKTSSTAQVTGYIIRRLAQNDNYVFATIRYAGGVKVDGVHFYGAIAVLKKSDFTVKAFIPTKTINTGIAVHGNYLAVGNQMYGLSFYNISSPENPILITQFQYNYKVDDSGNKVYEGESEYTSLTGAVNMQGWESQYGQFYEMPDGKLYYCNPAFGNGVTFYRVNGTGSTSIWMDGYYKFTGAPYHTMSAIVDYPYVYITAARNTSSADTEANTGVRVLKITGQPNQNFCAEESYCTIDPDDITHYTGTQTGDPNPCTMERVGDYLIQNYELGMLVYKINAGGASVSYVGRYKPTDDFSVYGMCVDGTSLYACAAGYQRAANELYQFTFTTTSILPDAGPDLKSITTQRGVLPWKFAPTSSTLATDTNLKKLQTNRGIYPFRCK